MSTVDFGGTTKTVCLAYRRTWRSVNTPSSMRVSPSPGSTRASANCSETLKMFDELGILDEELGA